MKKRSGFKLRSGNKPDMKGLAGINQRMDKSSKPDGRAKSSAFQKDEKVVQGGTKKTVDVKEKATERHKAKFDRVKKTKGSDDTKTTALGKEYGGTWSRQKDSRASGTGTMFKNQDGQTAKEAAIAQGQAMNKKKADYIKKNTTKKPGAPAIWPFKKKVKTSGAVLDREKKKKSRPKKIKANYNNKLRNAFNKTTKKISDKIKEPGKKGNIPGFN